MNGEIIRKLAARDVLTDEEKRVLQQVPVTLTTVPAGQDLVREGDMPSDSCLLMDGWAARYKVTAEGKRQIMAVHISGDFVDLHSLLLKPMDHSVVALNECRVALVSHQSLREITETQPHLTRMLWLNTLLDSAMHRQWLLTVGRMPARATLAHFICEMYVRLNTVGQADDGRLRVPMTQATLADTLALSTVHVNRLIQDFRQEGLLTWKDDQVIIHDWDRLAEIAEFDPTYLNLITTPR
jgi:CRP-like cAMP-binding protein